MKIIALGNRNAGDDGAAIAAAEQLTLDATPPPEIIFAGRPGTGLLDLLDGNEPVILLDVVQGSGKPGTITTLSLSKLTQRLASSPQTSSHGFGPTEVLSLAQALGRTLPDGYFVGIEGEQFQTGDVFSASIQHTLPQYVSSLQNLLSRLK
ncbi:MAG: hydrogenase maturation protease [Gammaproteobacteria bacterium]|nr:hydrogenase maturation protease [Gammaproteobacteria bacterium]